MSKFSIIIPVYNTEKYIKRCIESILCQSFSDYEIIVVNDNSTDKSKEILLSYGDKIKLFDIDKKNGIGPSHARNYGVSKSTGEYILFLDSDDYFEKDLLKEINDSLTKDYDIVRFQVQYDKNGEKEVLDSNISGGEYRTGVDSFAKICQYTIVDVPWCYAYKSEYYKKNKFEFSEGLLHEDFGLIPLVIINAGKVKCIDYVGYNYVIRENSIMTSQSYKDNYIKANHVLKHFENIIDNTKNFNGDLSIFNSFIANSVLEKACTLKGKDYKNYIKKAKKYNIYNMILSDTLIRKIKKIIIMISPKLYFKIIKR